MFQLNEHEFEELQGITTQKNYGGRRTKPYVFTENGIAMLSNEYFDYKNFYSIKELFTFGTKFI